MEGRWNRGLQLDGTSQFATIGSGYIPPFGTSARTTMAWIKTTGTGAIIAWGPNTTSRKWHMRLENGTQFTGALRVEIGGGFVRGTRDLRDGQWHHVAGVLPTTAAPNATNILLYVDGMLEALSEATSSPINTDAVAATIGVDSQNRFFPGTMDEVRIFHRALTAAEIAAIHSASHQSAAAWHYRHFGEAPMLWDMDDDGDGGARLLEYALRGQPHIPDRERLRIAADVADGHLRVTFPRRLAGTAELEYVLQASEDLKVWSIFSASETRAVPGDVAGFEEVTFRADDETWQAYPRFVRLSVFLH